MTRASSDRLQSIQVAPLLLLGATRRQSSSIMFSTFPKILGALLIIAICMVSAAFAETAAVTHQGSASR